MARGNAEFWSEIMPIIQGFIEGKPIQRLGYDGRWVDVKELHSIISSSHRIRPDTIKNGVWARRFEQKISKGSFIEGTQYWFGTSQDEPQWELGVHQRKFTDAHPGYFYPEGSEAYRIIAESFNQNV